MNTFIASILLIICAILLLQEVDAKTKINIAKERPSNKKYEIEMIRIARAFQQMGLDKMKDNPGGGSKCISCVIVIRMIERLAAAHDESVKSILDKICDLFPSPTKDQCHKFVPTVAWIIQLLLSEGAPPDSVCKSIHLCTGECVLFKNEFAKHEAMVGAKTPEEAKSSSSKFAMAIKKEISLQFSSWWDDIVKTISDHKPIFDTDSDYFSTVFGLRGYAWRGKDCDDSSDNVYPGRKTPSGDATSDYNCNGIHGKDPESGKPWKEVLCKGTDQKGVIVLGDSLAAHFRIPQQWVLPNVTMADFSHIVSILENELDWPHLSMYTGYTNDTTGLTPSKTQSIYSQLLARNLCNRNDFQNIGVNGARTGAMASKISKTINRDPENDHPAIVFHALVGNDVCSPHIGRYTPREDFIKNVEETFSYLDTKLPQNSTVIAIGLAQGGFLYDIMSNLTHPLGVPYKNVYDFLTCLEMNPCSGWLSNNATLRAETSAHAEMLSATYDEIIAKNNYKNFNVLYYKFPLTKEFIEEFVQQFHLPPSVLIEPMDSFHASQLGQEVLGLKLFQMISEDHPDLFGPINPNNDKIRQLFGN
mmetsp:Transcript_7814/g.11591  ORF Transcript_7814/g.11591 Transcript_7814/m.11591 type:complete len:588 (+) Transcript_7814:41-1804(+)